MKEFLYDPVHNKEVTIHKYEKKYNKRTWKPLFRQILICSGVWNSFFITGLCLGAPTVLIPQFRKEANSSDVISDEMASWISSFHGYTSIPWFILPILSGYFGRKYPFFFVSIISLISYIMFYCSVTPTHILIAEALQAPIFTCSITVSIIIVTEYTSPKYRGLFLTLKSASLNWGIWIANSLGTFFHWRTIAILGIICSLYNMLTTLFWCESPSWLATKGRYEECTRVHRWIKGKDEDSEKELAALIKSCTDYREIQEKESKKRQSCLKSLSKTVTNRIFFKPLLLSMGMLSLYHTSGKLVCTVYAIDIIKKMTSAESTAYIGMLLLDGVTVTGMYIGSGLTKKFKRRTLLLTGSIGGISFLFILASYLFLVKLKIIIENKYVSLGILMLFFLFISFGPIILSTSIYGEIIPIRFRTAGMFLTGFYTQILLGTALKTAPLIFKTFELHGAFFFYAVTSSFIIVALYKFLPETKDKTLQEIEQYFIGKEEKEKLRQTQLMFE